MIRSDRIIPRFDFDVTVSGVAGIVDTYVCTCSLSFKLNYCEKITGEKPFFFRMQDEMTHFVRLLGEITPTFA